MCREARVPFEWPRVLISTIERPAFILVATSTPYRVTAPFVSVALFSIFTLFVSMPLLTALLTPWRPQVVQVLDSLISRNI